LSVGNIAGVRTHANCKSHQVSETSLATICQHHLYCFIFLVGTCPASQDILTSNILSGKNECEIHKLNKSVIIVKIRVGLYFRCSALRPSAPADLRFPILCKAKLI